jgi:methylase of polypeptide subunit release factors
LSPLTLLRRAARELSRSPRVAGWLFGVGFPPAPAGERYFDLTTPGLVRVVRRHLGPGSRVLDMGTGAFGTVGLALWRRTGCRVVATDIHPDLVRRAQANIRANGAPIPVVLTRFFEGLAGDFDCLTFNIPYVPTRLVQDASMPQPYAFQSDGGPDGTSVIQAFLAAFESYRRVSTAYLGINALLVGRDRMVPLLQTHPGLALRRVERAFPLPVDVYALGLR